MWCAQEYHPSHDAEKATASMSLEVGKRQSLFESAIHWQNVTFLQTYLLQDEATKTVTDEYDRPIAPLVIGQEKSDDVHYLHTHL